MSSRRDIRAKVLRRDTPASDAAIEPRGNRVKMRPAQMRAHTKNQQASTNYWCGRAPTNAKFESLRELRSLFQCMFHRRSIAFLKHN